MCGVIGLYFPNTKVHESDLHEITKSLIHRGPDNHGIWISDNKQVGLGHRRLSIVDALQGHQPMSTKDKSIVITVNGEFYDDAKLRIELEAKGYCFQTRSDSELLLYLYQEYGLDFVHKLRGEFAFILYDEKNKKMIAVRDRFGIKPLCYHIAPDKSLYIGSEAKALFAAGVKAEWNEYAMYHISCFQYKPQDQTIFQEIYQLPPGHMLIYNGSDLKIEQYWDLNLPDENAIEAHTNEIDLIDELKFKMNDAVSCRLRSDGLPICCHLSGGIDSATIAAIGSALSKNPLHCFTVSFKHDLYNESRLANDLANFIGAPISVINVDAEDIVNNISEAVYYSEELAINNHLAAKYILNKEIKKAGFKIVLSGEGSDEIFAGYPHLKHDHNSNYSQSIFQTNIISKGIQISNAKTLPLDNIEKALGYLPSFIKAKSAIGLQIHELLSDDFKFSKTSNEIYANVVSQPSVMKQLQGRSKLDQSSYLWVKYALAGYILKALGDGCEMAHGVEGRVPFLDHFLFEFVKKIPARLKIKQGIEKYILRETVKPYVTPEIYQREKHPFMAPPLSLLNNKKGFDFINDHLRSIKFNQLRFYDGKKVALYLDKYMFKSTQEQIASEPVLMLLLTSLLLGQKYSL